MKRTIILLAIGAFVATGCFTKNAPKTTVASTKNYTEAELEKGHTIFTGSCNKCHKYKEPAQYSKQKWTKVLPSMIKKAKLSAEDGEVLTAWVMAHAK